MKIRARNKKTKEIVEISMDELCGLNPLGSPKYLTNYYDNIEIIPEILCPKCGEKYDEYEDRLIINTFRGNCNMCQKCGSLFHIKEKHYYQTEEIKNEKD